MLYSKETSVILESREILKVKTIYMSSEIHENSASIIYGTEVISL